MHATQSIYTSYRGFIRGKTRITLAWIFVLILGIFSRNTQDLFYPSWPLWVGLGVAFLGASLRFWASGFLRKDSRPAVGGPYAYVRNPLYLGTYLMGMGFIAIIQNYWLLVLSSVFFAAIYHYIILDEEIKLDALFGEPYLIYKKLVPRFFPRLWPTSQEALSKVNSENSHRKFSTELAHKNKAYEAYVSFVGLWVWMFLAAQVWENFLKNF